MVGHPGVAAFAVATLMVGACTSLETRPSSRPRPEPQTEQPPSSRPSPEPERHPLYEAKSEQAVEGEPYRFRLHTHCGVDWSVDFDGAFWDAVHERRAINRGAYRGLENPSDRGTMTLSAQRRAVYESRSGAVVRFRRSGPTRRISPCF